MTLEMKNNIVKKTLKIVRTMTQMTATASRRLFSMTILPDMYIMRFRGRLSETKSLSSMICLERMKALDTFIMRVKKQFERKL